VPMAVQKYAFKMIDSLEVGPLILLPQMDLRRPPLRFDRYEWHDPSSGNEVLRPGQVPSPERAIPIRAVGESGAPFSIAGRSARESG
jgi:hypothetical protein